MNLHTAQALAEKFKQALIPHAERVEIAGSIRRQKPDVKDIEIVCLARIHTLETKDMFGELIDTSQVNLTHTALKTLPQSLGWHLGNKNGVRFKQYIHFHAPIKLDLFITPDPAEWGVLYLIRTGSADFNKAFMTYLNRRNKHITGNRLHGHGKTKSKDKDGKTIYLPCEKGSTCPLIIPTPEEDHVFHALKLPWIPPPNRNPQTLRRLIKKHMAQPVNT